VIPRPRATWRGVERNGWGARVSRPTWGGLESDGPDDVIRGSPPPCEVVLQAIPAQGLDATRLLWPAALSALRLLRHWVEERSTEGGTVVGITSAVRGEGKTRLAAQLALALAESERARVLLVEANFERPSLESVFGFKVPHGCGFSTQIQRKVQEHGP